MPASPRSLLSNGVYTRHPWLVVPDDEAFAGLFADCPEERFEAHAFHSFGRRSEVLRIEEGIFATCYGRDGAWNRMAGLFLPGALLGAPKAVLHPGEEMPLVALALSPVRARRMPAGRFRDLLAADSALELRFLRDFARHQEAQLEGMLVNDADDVSERLGRLLLVLSTLSGPSAEGAASIPLPVFPRVSELAVMVHATRSAVSRIMNRWERAGLVGRDGGTFFLSRDLADRCGTGVRAGPGVSAMPAGGRRMPPQVR